MPEAVQFPIFPLVGALVGWLTNWLAIRMLFRPRRPLRILGLSLQGVIPRRHAQLADRIAETVESSLLTQQDLEKAMSGVKWREEVESLVRKVLHDRGPGGIIERIPGISQAWKTVVLPPLQEVLTAEIVRFLGRYRSAFIRRLRGSVDIRQIVRSRVEAFEMEALEGLVLNVARKEFVHIQWVGAFTGALIGVIQGVLFLLTA